MRISPLYEAVVLALGIVASANAASASLAIGKMAPDSITEDLTISGAYDMAFMLALETNSTFQVRTYQLILPKALVGDREM